MNEIPNAAYYLYGLTHSALVPKAGAAAVRGSAGVPANLADTTVLGGCGVDGEHPPFCWRHGELAAILSLVSRDDFCGPAAEANLRDLAWVGPRVCRHQAVLEQALPLAPVWPSGFGTLFSSLDVLGQYLERHRLKIAGFLDGVTGREEWAVKASLDRSRAEAECARRMLAADPARPAASPGLAYLREQQLRLQVKGQLADRLAGACRAALAGLLPLAPEMRERDAPSPGSTGTPPEVVWNWAFLVPRPAVADFQRRVQRLNAGQDLPGLTLAVSGPWPPYSFCPALEAPSA